MRVYTGGGPQESFVVGPSAHLPVVAALAHVPADWGLLSSCTVPRCMRDAARVCLLGRSGSHSMGMEGLGRVVLAVGLVFTLAGIRLG